MITFYVTDAVIMIFILRIFNALFVLIFMISLCEDTVITHLLIDKESMSEEEKELESMSDPFITRLNLLTAILRVREQENQMKHLH